MKIYQNLKYERNFQETYDACNKNFLKVGVYFLWLFPKNWSEVVFLNIIGIKKSVCVFLS